MRLLIAVIATCCVLIAGCQSRKIDNSIMVDPDVKVSYSQDIQPIFNTSCGGGGCHINSTTNGVRLKSYATLMASRGFQYNGPIVIAGKPSQSPLVDKINAGPEYGIRMPYGRAPLSGEQIGLITQWIEEGAEDN